MSAQDNIKVIQDVYEAFGRGDVEAIVAALSDDVDWAAEASSTAAPWWGVRRGKEGAGQFFQDFGSTMEVTDFTPISFAANDTDVLTVVRFSSVARATGKTSSMHLHHFFRFTDGKISYYRGTEDTLATVAALTA